MTYEAYDINGYTFYTEEEDMKSDYQNSGVTMESYTGNDKGRYYGRIEEIWELSFAREKVPMFRARWAKSVLKEDRYFTTMDIHEAKSKTAGANVTAKNEPWVLACQVDQCFFITDPSKPSRVVVRRGKRNIIRMDGVANEQDLHKYGDPKMEDDDDDEVAHNTRRTTMAALPFAMAEVYDANSHLITGGELRALQPIFKIYGWRQVFTAPIVTLKVFEDNVVVCGFLEEKAQGRVLVVDGGGSLRCSILHDT
ncbi:hypothetical protein ZWY2020_042066 [Hordeum vulgare]|nr:hypothetical protein ZWY2020_042066 [Hordeum vulgare]